MYLSKNDAANAYASKTALNDYLSKTDASTTYAKKTDLNSYATKTSLNDYVLKSQYTTDINSLLTAFKNVND